MGDMEILNFFNAVPYRFEILISASSFDVSFDDGVVKGCGRSICACIDSVKLMPLIVEDFAVGVTFLDGIAILFFSLFVLSTITDGNEPCIYIRCSI